MSINEYLSKMRNIQNLILEFIDENDGNDEYFHQICKVIKELKDQDNLHEIKLIILMISRIAANHHRYPEFFTKIFQIILYLKDDFKKIFTNMDIFYAFKDNKKVLLYLISEKILDVDQSIFQIIKSPKSTDITYNILGYLSPILKNFFDKQLERYQALTQNLGNWEEHVQTGENEGEIFKLIREDEIKGFIVYVTKNGINLNSIYKCSVYDTNYFFSEHILQKLYAEYSLIQYAAFFGSIQIYKYLQQNHVKLDKNDNLYYYAIHGRNPEIIHLLEEEKTAIGSMVINEAIKCHHNEIARYFIDNGLLFTDQGYGNDDIERISEYLDKNFNFISIMNYNFELINEKRMSDSFRFFCQCGYYTIVDLLLKTGQVDVNLTDVYFFFVCFL